MRTNTLRFRLVVPALAGLVLAANAHAAPCFTVAGTKVTVKNLFATGNPHIVDLEDMPSVSTMASRGSEAHNLLFMSIKRDAAKKNVTSFSATIDGKTYEFPKDACKGK
jgi:hypothetical protein